MLWIMPSSVAAQGTAWSAQSYCRSTVDGAPFDCGAVTYVPPNTPYRLSIRRERCIGDGAARECTRLPSNQVVEVTVLEFERHAVGERYTGPDEEAVMLHVRFRYLEAPTDPSRGTVIPFRWNQLQTYWMTSDGQAGRILPNQIRRPPLIGVGLEAGQEYDGWVGAYFPRGARDVALIWPDAEDRYAAFIGGEVP